MLKNIFTVPDKGNFEFFLRFEVRSLKVFLLI